MYTSSTHCWPYTDSRDGQSAPILSINPFRAVSAVHYNDVKIYSPTPLDASKALKLEDEFTGMTMPVYPSADKMKMSTPSCFPGRYSPTYRGPEQMRRCMANPSVSLCLCFSLNTSLETVVISQISSFNVKLHEFCYFVYI